MQTSIVIRIDYETRMLIEPLFSRSQSWLNKRKIVHVKHKIKATNYSIRWEFVLCPSSITQGFDHHARSDPDCFLL